MLRSPSLHPTSSTDQRCPSGHPARHVLSPEFIDVSPLGRLCELCRVNEARRKCRICGRYVCPEDFDDELGICIACKNALCDLCRSNLATSHCSLCGRIVCSSCSIDIDGVRRICFFCLIGSRSISLLSKVGRRRGS